MAALAFAGNGEEQGRRLCIKEADGVGAKAVLAGLFKAISKPDNQGGSRTLGQDCEFSYSGGSASCLINNCLIRYGITELS